MWVVCVRFVRVGILQGIVNVHYVYVFVECGRSFRHTISKNVFGRIMKYGTVVCESCLLGGNLLYLSQRKW